MLAALWAGVGFPQHSRAEQFDDIVVSPQPLHQGQTFHGYAEFRVRLENRSPKATHEVMLVYPDQAWPGANAIVRLSRKTALAPGARAVVTFWQPPLPIQGNSMLRVETDGEVAGRLQLPHASRHVAAGHRYSGAPIQTTILVSRSLDHAEVETAFLSRKGGAYQASAATGAPDGGGGGGLSPNVWAPEPSASRHHWLEVDYSPPLIADHVRIYAGNTSSRGGSVTLTGVSGTNLTDHPLKFGAPTPKVGRTSLIELTFSRPLEPVKSVRVEFASGSGYGLGVDAVELAGPSGSQWAVAARASSEASPATYGMPGHDTRFCLRAELPVSEWPDQWLTYSPYDALALTGTDFGSLPPGVADAFWRYVECGGNLLVFGGGELPAPWRAWEKALFPGGRSFAVGFGQCILFNQDRPGQANRTQLETLGKSADALARLWQWLPNDAAANVAFPVIDKLTLPIRGMVFLMLGFVLVIGPANFIVLSRLKRRTWLLWTIPAISFLTCGIVFAYSLLSEGITPNARIECVTLLDQVNRRATSLGAEAFYCPLTPNQGLRFGSETEVTPLVQVGDYRAASSREVDWTQRQHFRRGWITARVPAHFFLRKSESRRERLQVELAGGQLTVVNGLGASVRSLRLVDASGRIFTAQAISAGERAVLSPAASGENATGSAELADLLLKTGYGQYSASLSNNAAAYLRPGTYLAELEGSPFLENALEASAKHKRTRARCVLFGILDSAPATQANRQPTGQP